MSHFIIRLLVFWSFGLTVSWSHGHMNLLSFSIHRIIVIIIIYILIYINYIIYYI